MVIKNATCFLHFLELVSADTQEQINSENGERVELFHGFYERHQTLTVHSVIWEGTAPQNFSTTDLRLENTIPIKDMISGMQPNRSRKTFLNTFCNQFLYTPGQMTCFVDLPSESKILCREHSNFNAQLLFVF